MSFAKVRLLAFLKTTMRRASLYVLVVLSVVWAVQLFALEQRSPWVVAIANDDIIGLQRLFDHNTEVNSSDGAKRTALMIAAKYGRIELFRQLISRGANPHAQTVRGGTVLMFAVLGNDIKIVDELLGHEVSIDSLADNRWSALTIAAAKGRVEILQRLISLSQAINTPDIYGWTPLMRAVDNRHSAAVKVLLSHIDTKLNATNEFGETALHRAAINQDWGLTQLLLESGVDPDYKNNDGQTARQLLAKNGDTKRANNLFKRFLESSANSVSIVH